MPVSLASIRDLLKPGLYAVEGQYDSIEDQYSKIFTKRKSTMAVERKVQMAYLGYAQYKTEGGQTFADNNAGERYVYNAESFEVGLMYAITRKAIDDNLYKSEFKPQSLGLLRAFKEFKEYQHANIYNNGTTLIPSIGGDGQPLFSTAHQVDGGTVANTFSTPLQLNEASYLQALTNIRSTWVDERGLKIKGRGRQLIVPVALQPTAKRLLESELRPGTANNDVNVIQSMDGEKPTMVIWDYLTSPNAWFVNTETAKDSLLTMQRITFETDMQVDFTTDNLLVKGYERYVPTYNDWRCSWGSFPSS
jgi:phage major head subunit gpT-like protein